MLDNIYITPLTFATEITLNNANDQQENNTKKRILATDKMLGSTKTPSRTFSIGNHPKRSLMCCKKNVMRLEKQVVNLTQKITIDQQ